MTAIEQRQPALPKRIARQGSRAPAALRVLLACALAFSMIPLALALCPPSKDAVAHEPAVAQPRYPSLTDYLSRAQNERLVGGDAGATFAAQEGSKQHDDAANESDTPADAPMHEGNQPGADATSADNVQAAAAGAPSHASATEGQAPEPSAGQTEGPEAATTPEGTIARASCRVRGAQTMPTSSLMRLRMYTQLRRFTANVASRCSPTRLHPSLWALPMSQHKASASALPQVRSSSTAHMGLI